MTRRGRLLSGRARLDLAGRLRRRLALGRAKHSSRQEERQQAGRCEMLAVQVQVSIGSDRLN